jgi:hypothetical protein
MHIWPIRTDEDHRPALAEIEVQPTAPRKVTNSMCCSSGPSVPLVGEEISSITPAPGVSIPDNWQQSD